MKKVTIYTDGACKSNPGPGGWGAVLYHQDQAGNTHEKHLKGGTESTTNNRMELTAAICALQSLTEPCLVILFTDSNYVKQGITQWIHGWKKKRWKKSDGSAVLNVDLWQQLDELQLGHDIDWRWVKGHSGDAGNELADKLANEGVKPYLKDL